MGFLDNDEERSLWLKAKSVVHEPYQ